MKKINKFEGFYEDEESIKMMEIINKEAEKERERRMIASKKEKKADKWFKVGLFISIALLLTGILYLANKSYESNFNYCVANGHSAEVCEAHLSK